MQEWLPNQRLADMSNPYLIFAAIPIADSNPRIDVAVRPFLPIIFPASLAATVTWNILLESLVSEVT